MKRYIRSDANSDRLAFYKNGEIWHLPTWFADKSDDEIERLKQTVIDAEPHSYDSTIPAVDIDESKVRRDLRAEGFSRPEIDEIIAMVYNGMTMDGAIQRQLMQRDDVMSSSSATASEELTLHFFYPVEYLDRAEELHDLLDSKGIRHRYYPSEEYYGHEFFIGRTPGYTWNDIMKIVNSVKSAKYDKVRRDISM